MKMIFILLSIQLPHGSPTSQLNGIARPQSHTSLRIGSHLGSHFIGNDSKVSVVQARKRVVDEFLHLSHSLHHEFLISVHNAWVDLVNEPPG